MKLLFILLLTLCAACTHGNKTVNTQLPQETSIKVLIVDGQNNHQVWPKSTVMMKQYLEETGLFKVEVYRTKTTWKNDLHDEYYTLYSDNTQRKVNKPETDINFAPNFNQYDVVVSNFGWKAAPWPRSTQLAFETYMKNGGGFVTVHSSNNAFPQWLAYNRMIGIGGWGGRDETSGPYIYYNSDGKLVRDLQPGKGGAHGEKHELQLTQRNDHPILKGLPPVWMHTKDECYGNLRGPAEHLTVIATALCPKEKKGTGKHEPMLMVLNYGKGRIFHTTLGHDDYSFESVGFITTLVRGVEWAATGQVSQPVSDDFPSKTYSQKRSFTLGEQ